MAKILKNTTGSPVIIKDTGVTIPASGSYTVPPQDYMLWAASADVQTYISSGTITVNDGDTDLTVSQGANLVSCYENEEGLMLSKKLREHTGFTTLITEYPYQKTTITFDNNSRTLSISPKSPYTTIEFLFNDTLYQLSGTKTAQITDTEGVWYFYFDSTQTLVASQTPFAFVNQVFVAMIYWDSFNKKRIKFLDERHGAVMDATTHYIGHSTEGSRIDTNANVFTLGNYILGGDGSLNSHAQFSIGDGNLYDEDLICPIRNSASPVNPFEQVLSTVAYLPVFYMTGTQDWRRKDANAYAVVENPPGTAYYNNYSGGSWSLTSCTNSYFFATWVIITNDLEYPVCAILGQRQDSNLIEAINNNTRSGLQLPNFFSAEKYFLKKLIWQTDTSYGNTPKVRLMYVSAASEIAPTNDRYAVICSYNGNAGVGKYLEFYPGQSSDTSPFPIPEVSYARTITLSAIASSTGTVSFYKSTDLVNAIFSVSLSASTYTKYNLTYLLGTDDKLVAKLSSGSINKPAITLFIQTSLG